jgi:hypothetical protein
LNGFDGAPRIAPMGCRGDAYDGASRNCQESRAKGVEGLKG